MYHRKLIRSLDNRDQLHGHLLFDKLELNQSQKATFHKLQSQGDLASSSCKRPFWSAAVQEEEDDLQTLRRVGGLNNQLSNSSSFHLPIEPVSDPAKAEAKAKDDAEEEETK